MFLESVTSLDHPDWSSSTAPRSGSDDDSVLPQVNGIPSNRSSVIVSAWSAHNHTSDKIIIRNPKRGYRLTTLTEEVAGMARPVH